MVHRIAAFALVMLTTVTIATSQDDSYETFNDIVLESSSSPGFKIRLSPPSTGTSYQLTFPATLPTVNPTRRYSFSRAANSTTGGLSWYQTPYGAANQVSFFETSEELIGSSNFQWLNTDKTLSLTSTTNKPLISLSKTVDLSANDSIVSINATYSSLANSKVDTKLMSLVANASTLKNGSTVRGLDVDIALGKSAAGNSVKTIATGMRVNVSGGDTNRAAIFKGGFIGVNTDYPKVYMDVAGDVAFRELNYTGSFNGTNDNFDFDGLGNRSSFVRIASALSGSEGTLTGIAGGTSGKLLRIYNATGKTIRVKHNSSNTTTNSIKTSANADLLLLPGNTYEFVYSAAESKWLVTFSGPSELAQYGTQTVGPIATGSTLPSSIANYLQVTTTTGANNSVYDLYLESGTTPGQILVVQNNGPQDVKFLGTNVELATRSSTLKVYGAMVLIWSGSQWVQVALANN